MTFNTQDATAIYNDDTCWLCGGSGPDTTITVECETPSGKHCRPKNVEVHFGCYMDIDP